MASSPLCPYSPANSGHRDTALHTRLSLGGRGRGDSRLRGTQMLQPLWNAVGTPVGDRALRYLPN